MPSQSPVLVVGTTPDYVDYLRRAAPHRALFLTAPGLRSSSTEPAPPPDEEILCDPADTAAASGSLRNLLKGRRTALAGVACFDCESMEPAARLARDFGLPYPTPESIRLCRDKHRQKQVWRERALPCPLTRLIREPAEAMAFLRELGGPCVLKPLTGSGSELVFRCTEPGECQEAVFQIQSGLEARRNLPMYRHNCVDGAFAVAEEQIEGTEYSCDFFRQNGRTDILRLTRKHRAGVGPFGTTRAYETVAELDGGPTIDALESLLHQAVGALDIERSIGMVDFMVRDGEIVLLELTPRPGGDCLPELLRASAGFDILAAALDVAAGGRPKPVALENFEPCVGLRIHAAGPGKLHALHTDGLGEDPRIRAVTLLRKPGEVIRMPPDDYDSWLLGHVIFRPDSSSDVRVQCDEIQDRVTVSIEPPFGFSVADVPAVGLPSCAFLPAADLSPFVERFFAERQKYLDLAERHELPLYVLEPETLRRRAAELSGAFRRVLPDASFYYAVKSNNHPGVSRTLLDCGFGLDVSSGLELRMALDLDAEDIVFSGPAKTDPELRLAVEHAERTTVLIDSFGELRRLQAIAADLDVPVQAGVRLATFMQGFWRKFGVPLDRLAGFFAEAEQCSHVLLRGLQFHTSWNLTPQAQVNFLAELGAVLRTLPAAWLGRIEFLDMGGGFWPPQGEWLQEAGTPAGQLRRLLKRKPVSPLLHYLMPAVSISTFADALAGALRQHLPFASSWRACFEPGRWICNDAMHLLIRVIDKKDDDLVITDAGTNAVGWERFENDYFPVLNLSRPAREEKPCAVLGSLCTARDVWGYSYWGSDIQPGDVLLIPTQGAYTYSLRQHFIKPLPEVVTLPSEEDAAETGTSANAQILSMQRPGRPAARSLGLRLR